MRQIDSTSTYLSVAHAQPSRLQLYLIKDKVSVLLSEVGGI